MTEVNLITFNTFRQEIEYIYKEERKTTCDLLQKALNLIINLAKDLKDEITHKTYLELTAALEVETKRKEET